MKLRAVRTFSALLFGITLVAMGSGRTAAAQGSLQFAVPGLSIGINVPSYPRLVPVPGYPVYYAPDLDSNFFFYDGLYWTFVDDRWYASEWYDGPWGPVEPESVPYFVLRIPVHYYRLPPPYFRDWDRRAPPRWGEHWGGEWEQRHREWNRWNHSSLPPRAPLPDYQRHFPRDRYPSPDEQQPLRDRDYHFRPREPNDRRFLGQPSEPQRESDHRPQQNRGPTVGVPAPRGRVEQPRPEHRPDHRPDAEEHRSPTVPNNPSSAGEHHRGMPQPGRPDAPGVMGTSPRPAAPRPPDRNVPQPQRREEPPARPEMNGGQRQSPAQQRPQRVRPDAQPQSPQQPNRPRKDTPP